MLNRQDLGSYQPSGRMDAFCGSQFWNLSLTWNTNHPNFTECFEKTVLVWIPCIFLWLFLPLEIYYLFHSKFRKVPWNWLIITKFLLTVTLMSLCIADFIYALWMRGQDWKVFKVDFVTPLFKFATFFLAAVLVWCNKEYGMRTSGLLFLFWLLLMLCGIFQYHSELIIGMDEVENEDFFTNTTYLIYFHMVIILFLLNCKADAAPTISEYPTPENPCPEQGASFLSRLFYAWFEPMAWRGFRQPLETKDLWSMNPGDTAHEIIPKFNKYWEKLVEESANVPSSTQTSAGEDCVGHPVKKIQVSILPALYKAFGATILFASLLKLVQDLLTFAGPQILKLLIAFVAKEEEKEKWKGYFYSVLIFLAACIQTLIAVQYYTRMYLVGLRIRTALVSAIYRKALQLSSAARKESTVGEIVNLMSVDAQRLMDVAVYLCMLWSAPLQIALALYFLWEILGLSVLAGLIVMIILVPINIVVAKVVKSLQTRQMQYKDKRVKLMNEILNAMKVLKLYAWETSFQEQILAIREKEIHVLKKTAYLNAVTSFMWNCAPFLVTLATFAAYVMSNENHVLDSQKAFVSLTLFNIIRMPMTMLPSIIGAMVQAKVSINRINDFMNSEGLDPNNVTHGFGERYPLLIENGTFSWGPHEDPVLRNVNLHFDSGSLIAVVGSVGSGKSSLISSFLGEMNKLSGRVNTKGSIAYVPQQAWIKNAILQDNILFGKSMDHTKYKQVVKACALEPDFDILPAGDQTEIGEKGINLSGGQKQRVSLARAVYNNADIYFLDDPLSAVDSHVGKEIFQNVIGQFGILKNKTRVLVTHGVTFLPEVDQIVVLKNGEVTEMGTYKELLEKKGAFADFLLLHLQEISGNTDDLKVDLDELKQHLQSTMRVEEIQQKLIWTQPQTSESDSASKKGSHSWSDSFQRQSSVENGEKRRLLRSSSEEAGAVKAPIAGEILIETEKAETGSVKWKVYSHYLQSIGILLSVSAIILNIIFQTFSIGSNVWLSLWSTDLPENGTIQDPEIQFVYLCVYGTLGLGQTLSVLGQSLILSLGTIIAAANIHKTLLSCILHNPMNFFDTTPVGRIVNRFSKDVDVMDNTLSVTLQTWLYCFFSVIATLVVISYSTPLFVAVAVPVGILYYFVQRFYVATSRQLKRLESVSRSPIYSHFGESITGVSTIRAYGVQSRFIHESESKVDINQICYYPTIIANRWLAVRLEMVGNLIIFFAALFAVFQKDTNAGDVGLSVSYALQITQVLNYLVRMTSEMEANIVSVERIKEYGETPQEAAWDIPSSAPPASWPHNGEVEFKNYQFRYREGLELVLKGITFSVKGGQKVGIVGRTGAGKSSLTLALFRIIEAAGGSIFIDGQDISKMGLHILRSRLTIIPQDPVLFSGTLRMNLDPFYMYTDDDIWRALDHAHLKSFVTGLVAKLNHEVSEGGENLSVGQRQLICLARALLRKPKVLILDEATAAVDLETDDLIQKTIRTEFSGCTVLTIAHRLNTILDSDKIIVLDKGSVLEYDTPEVLLQNMNSVFYGMVKDAGLI